MTDTRAVLQGYTQELLCENWSLDLNLLVRPDTDTDGEFKAWCMVGQEFIRVSGWLFTITDAEGN